MNKKEFNPEIGLFATKDGKYSRINVNAAVYDLLQKATIGTSLLLMPVSDELREKIEGNGKTPPTHKLVILPFREDPSKSRSQSAPRRQAQRNDEL